MGATANPLAGLLGLTVGALLVSSGDAAGNAEVFDIGTSLKPFEYTVMMTLIIVGLVMFDFVLETFEHHLKHRKKRFHQRLLGKALKELMILGLISFVLFILKDQALYDQSDEVLTNTFEFVNLFLFFVGVSLVLAAVMLVMATSPIKARWDTYANANLENLLALHEETISKSWTWYTAWLPRYTLGLRQAQVIEYHLFRSVFLRLNRSLLTPAFDFSKYSGAIVDELIVVFFDVQWASWLLAVVVLFLTLPITPEEGGTAQVSAHGAILFGVALLALECVTCTYTHYAYQMVMARMGVVRGYKGVGKVLKELWVEPQHHMGQETTAIDVKGLLAAAPVNAPTLSQLTSEVSNTTKGASQAQINFKNERGSNTASGPIRRTSVSSTAGSSTHSAFSEERLQFSDIATSATVSTNANTYTISTNPNRINTITTTNSNSIDTSTSTNTTIPTAPMAEPAVTTTAAAAAVAAAAPVAVGQQPPRPTNGFTCTGCYDCDALFLPSGKVENCAMGGDPFVLMTLRPPQSVVDRLPELLKGVNIKVGSYFWFRTLFGMSTLHKCYYSAFYFSYAIGKATKSSDLYAFLWIVLTPLPLILSMLPLAKRTLPLLGQLSCLQGQIVWELVSDIEESQEIAMRAREKVLSKLQETLALKTKEINSLTKAGYYQADSWGRMTSPRSRALKNWFDEWDQNSDGQISQDELAKGLQKLGVFLSAVQLRELFRLADPDHSKSIDLAEFRAFLSDLQSLDTEPERFQRELQLRLQRSSYQKERSRPLPVDEFGLLTGIPVPAGSSFGRSRHARGRSMSSVDKSLGDDPPGTTVGRAWGAASNGGGGGEGGGGCGGGGGGGASGGGASGSSGVLGETTSGGIGGPPPLASHARRATISVVPGGTGGVSLRAFEFADVAIPEGKVEEV